MTSPTIHAETIEQLEQQLMRLPEESRARLAGRLIDSLDPMEEQEVEAAWARELERRSAELRVGEVETVPLSEALAKARKAVGRG